MVECFKTGDYKQLQTHIQPVGSPPVDGSCGATTARVPAVVWVVMTTGS